MTEPAHAEPAAPQDCFADEVTAVLAALGERGETVAVAESLTAGLITAHLADVPGASRSLRGGLVVYATDLKATLAGVPEALLAVHGPVSAETAASLAAGVRDRLGADWGLSVTGVAGPSEQDGVPVGTVIAAVARPGAAPDVRRITCRGDRRAVRSAAAHHALRMLLAALESTSDPFADR